MNLSRFSSSSFGLLSLANCFLHNSMGGGIFSPLIFFFAKGSHLFDVVLGASGQMEEEAYHHDSHDTLVGQERKRQ
jgi:hypothetical protein